MLLFVVETDGMPSNIRVMQSVTPEVDAIVVAAVSQWRFRPAKKQQQAVRQWVQQPIVLSEGSGSPFQL